MARLLFISLLPPLPFFLLPSLCLSFSSFPLPLVPFLSFSPSAFSVSFSCLADRCHEKTKPRRNQRRNLSHKDCAIPRPQRPFFLKSMTSLGAGCPVDKSMPSATPWQSHFLCGALLANSKTQLRAWKITLCVLRFGRFREKPRNQNKKSCSSLKDF